MNLRTLLSKNHNGLPVEEVAISPNPQVPRHYFEVYGDYLELSKTLTRVLFGFLVLSLAFVVLLAQSLKKAPLVIRVSEIGEATAIQNIALNNQITRVEVLNFVQVFMKYFMERNYYTWKDNLVESGKMMTPEFRQRLNEQLSFDQEVSAMQTKRLTSKLKFSNIEVLRETQGLLIVSIKAWRAITSYDDPSYQKETVFEAEISLQKVARTLETPYGLLVDSYKQGTFKDE